VVVNVFLLLQVTPWLSSYDATASAMIKQRKHQRPAGPLWQSGVITHNNRI